MPAPDPPPAPSSPDPVAARLQARFEGALPPAAPAPAASGLEPGRLPRAGARSEDVAAQRQLDDLVEELDLLRRQLDAAFDDLEARVQEAEVRARVAESRAAEAESLARDAEARVRELLDVMTELERRVGDGSANGPLRSAIGRLRHRLDAG